MPYQVCSGCDFSFQNPNFVSFMEDFLLVSQSQVHEFTGNSGNVIFFKKFNLEISDILQWVSMLIEKSPKIATDILVLVMEKIANFSSFEHHLLIGFIEIICKILISPFDATVDQQVLNSTLVQSPKMQAVALNTDSLRQILSHIFPFTIDSMSSPTSLNSSLSIWKSLALSNPSLFVPTILQFLMDQISQTSPPPTPTTLNAVESIAHTLFLSSPSTVQIALQIVRSNFPAFFPSNGLSVISALPNTTSSRNISSEFGPFYLLYSLSSLRAKEMETSLSSVFHLCLVYFLPQKRYFHFVRNLLVNIFELM
jgi:hypothetical protein